MYSLDIFLSVATTQTKTFNVKHRVRESSIYFSFDIFKTSSLPDCSQVLISLNLKPPILFALMCPSLRFDRWLLAFWSKSAHISFSASVPPSTWTWSVSPSMSESLKKLSLNGCTEHLVQYYAYTSRVRISLKHSPEHFIWKVFFNEERSWVHH